MAQEQESLPRQKFKIGIHKQNNFSVTIIILDLQPFKDTVQLWSCAPHWGQFQIDRIRLFEGRWSDSLGSFQSI